MSDASDTNGFLRALGEAIGGFIAGLPSAISSFFSGVGAGAGVHGFFDWAALIVGIALLLSVVRDVRRGRIVWPAIRGVIALAVMGWAIA